MPQPDSHAILTSYQDWSKSGHILGGAISRLNFPDNSVIFLAETDQIQGIALPPINSSIVLPNSSMLTNQILVDNNILNHIQKHVPDANPAEHLSLFENTAAPFVGMPLVLEAARIRKRGLPLCTPLLFGKNCDRVRLVLALQNIIEEHGAGVVILSNSFIHEINQNNEFIRTIGLSFLPEILPLFFKKDYNGITLMTYLAHRFNASIEIISEGKYVSNNTIFEELALGISKNKTYNSLDINNIETRKKIWVNVLNAIKNLDYVKLDTNGSALVKIRDSNNRVLYNKLFFDKSQNLGRAIWEASRNIFDDFGAENLDNYFIDIICIKNPESLLNIKGFNRIDSNNYHIITDNENPQNILVEESVSKTIQKFSIDVNHAYLYQPFTVSLPLNVILLLHDIDYPNAGFNH